MIAPSARTMPEQAAATDVVRLEKPGGIDRLVLGAGETPKPGLGEVTVRVRAATLNFHDYLVVNGTRPADDGRVPLSDGAGEVVEVGPGVTDLKPGDAVVSLFFPDWVDGEGTPENLWIVPGDRADGFAAKYVTRPAAYFTRQPAGYSHAESCTLPCAGVTAWRGLFIEGRVKAGDTVLLQGSGGVSVFALQFAKAAGATVIVTSSSDEKLQTLKAMGADHLINYRTDPDWERPVMEITNGRGVDLILDVGGPGTLPHSILAARMGGRIVVIGVLDGYEGVIPTALILRRQLRLQGLVVGSRRHQLDMIKAIEATGIRPMVDDKRFSLATLPDAFRYLERGGHFGKICVEI
ncbi:MAG: NAD(P)-dependent alcohol dehydrogenase [Phenylobacterium sp.]|uniref:zinc-dependent alcohol dehydrogenase family protein n=1 Tax=Phenylobacterium sp. TaxID=1871053 RepID=UPI00273426EC|nr:NAD(P)-dependent alcohol dehydrogenase [Phenylobacterium sp.]MDP3750031.1 NAD(P)-dependent alcohol dehydrogenase [Phenylobacterium sp.]